MIAVDANQRENALLELKLAAIRHLPHDDGFASFGRNGVLLGMMLRIFDDTTWRQRHVSNVAVSVLFGVTHIHFGLAAVGLTTAFSLLLGADYLRYRNLAGPILIHTVVGIAAFMFGIL